jgi:coatomer subunit beta'
MSLLGYIPAQNRVYVMDKDTNVSGYSLALSVIEYQTAVLRGDMAIAEQILPSVPKDQRNKVARFLEGKGMW